MDNQYKYDSSSPAFGRAPQNDVRRRVIKFKCLAICIALAIAVNGCAGKPKDKNKKEIVIWHWLSEREQLFNEFAKEYKEITGITVKLQLYAPTSAYSFKIRAAAQAKTLPDIYGILMEMKDFASLIKAGHVVNLTPAMNANSGEWRNSLYSGGLIMNTFLEGNEYGVPPGIYGVPVDINNIQLIYNLNLLKKAGWDTTKLPATWDEFLALGRLLKKAGIPGMVSGWGETWMVHCMADNFAWNILGKDKILSTIRGNVPYTDPEWIRVFTLFKEMRDNGLISDGIVTMINKEAEQTFANERAAIAFNGSWCVNVYESMNPGLRYAVAAPPRVNETRPMFIWGGTTSFVVNNRSPMKKEAIGFLKWLTESKQECKIALETRNIPSNRECSNVLSGPIVQFADGMDNVVHPRLLPVEEFPLVTEAFDKGIQSIIIGESTPLEAAKMIQKTKERELARHR